MLTQRDAHCISNNFTITGLIQCWLEPPGGARGLKEKGFFYIHYLIAFSVFLWRIQLQV